MKFCKTICDKMLRVVSQLNNRKNALIIATKLISGKKNGCNVLISIDLMNAKFITLSNIFEDTGYNLLQ